MTGTARSEAPCAASAVQNGGTGDRLPRLKPAMSAAESDDRCGADNAHRIPAGRLKEGDTARQGACEPDRRAFRRSSLLASLLVVERVTPRQGVNGRRAQLRMLLSEVG